MKKRLQAVILLSMIFTLAISLGGCDWAGFQSSLHELKGSIKGNTYECQFYSNSGELFMTAKGKNIHMSSNIVDEYTYSGEEWIITETISSVITITIDGKQIESCGSTVIFEEQGLKPDVEFDISNMNISSDSNGIGDMTIVAETVNQYKNYFGKATVVVIQSQLGDPICAYSGEDVYWEVCEDLPKTTKLMIDGKALYIHRANFQIIDKDLLTE